MISLEAIQKFLGRGISSPTGETELTVREASLVLFVDWLDQAGVDRTVVLSRVAAHEAMVDVVDQAFGEGKLAPPWMILSPVERVKFEWEALNQFELSRKYGTAFFFSVRDHLDRVAQLMAACVLS